VTNASGAPAAGHDLLDERYGRSRKRKFDARLAWGAGGALVIAGLAFVLFGGWQQGTNIEFKDLHYEVLDARTAQVDAQVTGPPGAELVCTIEAMSESYATVGWKVVPLAQSEERTRRFTEQLRTTAPATTVSVRECWNNAIG